MLKANALHYERMIAVVGLFVCCGLLMLAVPRFVASLYALYPEAALQQTLKNVPPGVYGKSIEHLDEALNWYENPEYRQALAVFYLAELNASPLEQPAKKIELLKRAQASIVQGLKLSPVDAFAWFRLAAVNRMLNLPVQDTINALRLSFYAGRVEPALIMPRLSFSYVYYNEYNEEMQGLWKKQIPVAWRFQRAQLVKFVALHPAAKHLVEEAFIYSPDDWKKFSHALEIYLQKHS